MSDKNINTNNQRDMLKIKQCAEINKSFYFETKRKDVTDSSSLSALNYSGRQSMIYVF